MNSDRRPPGLTRMTTVNAAPAVPEIIWTFDLSPITRRLERKGMHDAPRLEAEFRRVAALFYLHPTEGIAPSAEIDEFWHEFILDTHRYRAFCAKAYGAYMDHCPDDTNSGMWPPYERTKELYRAQFGELDPNYWGTHGANSMQCQRPPD